MKETKLKTIEAQEAQKMKEAIEDAILNGAKVTDYVGTVVVGDLILVKSLLKGFTACLNFESDILADKIKPSRAQVEAQLRAAEEEVIRVKNQLKQYDNETNND